MSTYCKEKIDVYHKWKIQTFTVVQMETKSRLLPRLAWPLNNQSAVSWPVETRPETNQNKRTQDLKRLATQ